MPREYNVIYSKIIEGEDDVVGTIAYSIYKRDKITFIKEYKNKHNDQHPTESDFKQFHEMICTEGHIGRYRMQAYDILNSFLNETLSEMAAQINDDCKNNHQSMLKEIVENTVNDIINKKVSDIVKKQIDPIKPKGFFYGVWQSMLGAFLFMIAACGLIFVATFSQREYTFTIGGSGQATVKEKTQGDSIPKEKPLKHKSDINK